MTIENNNIIPKKFVFCNETRHNRTGIRFMSKKPTSIYQILESIVENDLVARNPTQRTLQTIVVPKPQDKDFYNTEIDNLNFRLSDTFLTLRDIEEFRRVLGDPSDFASKTDAEKRLVQDELSKLVHVESDRAVYTKRLARDPDCSMYITKFHKEFKNFSDHARTYVNPGPAEFTHGQRSSANHFPKKAAKLMRFIGRQLVIHENLTIFKQVEFLSDVQLEAIYSNNMPLEWIFSDLVRISVEQAHDNLFTPDGISPIGITYPGLNLENALRVRFTSLLYRYPRALAYSIIMLFLDHIQTLQKGVLTENYPALPKHVEGFLFHKASLYSYSIANDNGWGVHVDNTATLIDFFVKSGFFNSTLKMGLDLKEDRKSEKICYILPKTLETKVLCRLFFPRVCPPDPLTLESVTSLVKPLMQGISNVSPSKHLVYTLNASQSHKFRVASAFRVLISQLLDNQISDSDLFDLGFPTIRKVNVLKKELDSIKSWCYSLNGLQLGLAYETKRKLMSEYSINLSNMRQLLSIAGATQLEYTTYLYIAKLEEDLKTMEMNLKFVNTHLAITEIVQGFPLYITETLCVRLRMYPEQVWLSRASRVLNPLLCESRPKQVTLSGVVHMLKAYYAPSEELSEKFKIFLQNMSLSEKKINNVLFTFFRENYLNFYKVESAPYFMNLHMELIRVGKTGKSGVLLEIDQTASAIVFLSLILRSKAMASVCNIINMGQLCPYETVKKRYREFAEKGMRNRVSSVDEFLSSSKKLHKSALMSFCYNQTDFVRMIQFTAHWHDHFKREPMTLEQLALNEFSAVYPMFVDFVFPGTSEKLDLLKSLVEKFAKETGKVSSLTLEGEVISWFLYKYKKQRRSKFNPIQKTTDSKYNISLVSCEGGERKTDVHAHLMKFLPYLIHSIDAAVMRRIIRRMRTEHGYDIRYLHDCAILHPNEVDNFYKLVKDIYSGPDLYNMIDTLVFKQMYNEASDSLRSEIAALRERYMAMCDDFKNELGEFRPEVLYNYKK